MNRLNLLWFLGVMLFSVISCAQKKKTNVTDVFMEKIVLGDSSFLGQEYLIYGDGDEVVEKGYLVSNKKQGIIRTYTDNKLFDVSIFESDTLLLKAFADNFVFKKIFATSNVSILKPVIWDLVDVELPFVLACRCASAGCFDSLFAPNFSLIAALVPDEMSESQYIYSSKQSLFETLSNFHLVSESKIEVSSLMSHQITYTFYDKERLFGGVTTWYFIKNEVYILNGVSLINSPLSFLEYKCLFQEISNSFEYSN